VIRGRENAIGAIVRSGIRKSMAPTGLFGSRAVDEIVIDPATDVLCVELHSTGHAPHGLFDSLIKQHGQDARGLKSCSSRRSVERVNPTYEDVLLEHVRIVNGGFISLIDCIHSKARYI
jgi:hypothetical protein